MNLKIYKCPECGAGLEIDGDRKFVFCQFCGTKIILENENEHIYRHIDDAEIKHAETEQMVELKKLEMAEKQRIADEKNKLLKIKISLILAVVGILLMVIGCIGGSASGDSDSGLYMLSMFGFFPLMGVAYIWLFSSNKEKENVYDGRVKVPYGISDYEHKNYSTIDSMFRSAGFTNIQCIPMNDLTMGILKKPGMVDSITINGESVSSGGEKFYPNASVIISYHSFANK